jgi:hypothetical protein
VSNILKGFKFLRTGQWIEKTSTTAQYISQLMFPQAPTTGVHYLFGLGIHIFIGGLVGILLLELYQRYGDQYPYFKGMSLGASFWILHVVIIPNVINRPNLPYLHRNEMEALVDLISHLVFGICAASMYKKLRRA